MRNRIQSSTPPVANRSWLQPKAKLRLGKADDAQEREADRTAEEVAAGRHLPSLGRFLSRIPVARVQREEDSNTASDEEKYKEAAKKTGEAFLETELGKKLTEKVKQDPLVRAGEAFVGTLAGKVITGAAAAGAVAALAATESELPIGIPEIPLDQVSPGLKMKITYEGRVNKPTKAMIAFTYTEQVAAGGKPSKTRAERQREENARMALEQHRFRQSLRYAPGSPEALERRAEEAALREVVFAKPGKVPGIGTPGIGEPSPFPRLPKQPEPYRLELPGLWRPKPVSLLDEELKLKPLEELSPDAEPKKKKKEEGRAVQRKRAGHSAIDTAPPIVHQVLSGPGQPLDPSTRECMEEGFGEDFSAVRIHTDARAGRSARAIDALAYTVGHDLVFSGGAYAPTTAEGRRLLAHELTHVIQQRAAAPAPKDGLSIASGSSPLEREADRSADDAIRGRAVPVRSLSPLGSVQRLQRAEHGTYVSTRGDRTYLDAGARFYRTWGHPNVRRVATIEEVLRDLDRARGTIDKFRIVSHGTGSGLDLGLLPQIEPDLFGRYAAAFTTERRFRKRFAKTRLVTEAFFKRIYSALQKDTKTAPLLTTLGAGTGAPDPLDALGILLRALVDQRFLADVTLNTGKKPKIAHKAALDTFVNRRLTLYRRVVLRGTSGKRKKELGKAIAGLIKHLPQVMKGAKLNFSELTQQEADTLADPFTEQIGQKTRLRRDLSKAVEEGAGGPYLRRLRRVKGKIDDKTHIEIRGCNVGRGSALLDTYRGYFGRPNNLPSISAPDLFQYFFRLSFETYGTKPVEETRLRAAFADPTTGLAQGFEDLRRMQAGEMIRVVDRQGLTELAGKYGFNAGQLRKLNPEIQDPSRLRPGDIVWLVRRKKVPAGIYKKLEDFCRDYLGNRYAWPTVWAANSFIKDPRNLKPTDQLQLPAAVLTPPVAAAAPTVADFAAAVRGGKAVAGLSTTANRPVLHMDNPQRAKALGEWLAAQKFDPKGRTAAALGNLYRRNFRKAAARTYVQLLSRSYPNVVDPIFPEDPRYDKHIVRRP